jgi:hypothetical protein
LQFSLKAASPGTFGYTLVVHINNFQYKRAWLVIQNISELRGRKEFSILAKCCGGTAGEYHYVITNMSHLEASGAPVHKLDGALGFDGGNSSIHVLWNNVTPINIANIHVHVTHEQPVASKSRRALECMQNSCVHTYIHTYIISVKTSGMEDNLIY